MAQGDPECRISELHAPSIALQTFVSDSLNKLYSITNTFEGRVVRKLACEALRQQEAVAMPRKRILIGLLFADWRIRSQGGNQCSANAVVRSRLPRTSISVATLSGTIPYTKITCSRSAIRRGSCKLIPMHCHSKLEDVTKVSASEILLRKNSSTSYGDCAHAELSVRCAAYCLQLPIADQNIYVCCRTDGRHCPL